MKRSIAVIVFLLILSFIPGASFAQSTVEARSSGILNSSAVVTARSARLVDLAVYTASADVTVTCYDNKTTNSGTVIAKATVLAAAKNGGDLKAVPVRAAEGIYCVLSGTGGTYIVYYDPR